MRQPHNPRDCHGHSPTGVETAAGFGLLGIPQKRRKTDQNDDFRVLTSCTHIHAALFSRHTGGAVLLRHVAHVPAAQPTRFSWPFADGRRNDSGV